MRKYQDEELPKSDRIKLLVDHLFEKMPEIEADRAELLTKSYEQTEGEPMITRRAKAFYHICENIPITIRKEELIVGSATKAPRGCQVFPEFSYEWLAEEFNTIETRSADPFYISEDTKNRLHKVYPYWKGKTTSELAESYMAKEAKSAIDHNIFTPGNYFYNGVGHVTVNYKEILDRGLKGIKEDAQIALNRCEVSDMDYCSRSHFLNAVILSCDAAITYAKRYEVLALQEAKKETNARRKKELMAIAGNCRNVPEYGAKTFWEACQSFWFIQMLLQMESSGHSISPGRFDQYMYAFYQKDIENQVITRKQAQEYIDCIWVKLNDLNKVRDADSAEGFAGYSLFQNLIVGGQDSEGLDVTNDLSFMCIDASHHVFLPQPSLSIRVWNKTPHELLMKAAGLTRTGIGLPAYYNDEVIIPSLLSSGLTLEDARDYNIIGCVEPQKAGKTDGWHDAAFYNMLRPLELVFSNGIDLEQQISIKTGDVTKMKTFDEFYHAYQLQTQYLIGLLVNADNAIDMAHRERCPLPFLSGMIEDCIGRGKSVQEGGAVYNFTGPQGFGVANMADAMYAIKKLVYDEKKITMSDLKAALINNFSDGLSEEKIQRITENIIKELHKERKQLSREEIEKVVSAVTATVNNRGAGNNKYSNIKKMLDEVDKFGNDKEEVDAFARDVAYTYTKPLKKYKNPRGGNFQAGLYPVSANVPLGAQTGATPDGRYAFTPVADGVSPSAGKDIHGPTSAANSVSKLDHSIASNGTLFNQKFHPSALAGRQGLENFIALIRSFFDQKGSHMQFNVVDRNTLLDAQKNPEKYQGLVVRVAGYSALFTTLSKSLQDDIIGRTEQGF